MGIVQRKGRQRADREHRIVAAARGIAAAEGWSAVTIRRLAEEIEYSQPVLYSHFANRDAIIAAVAVEGFRDLAAALRQARAGTTDARAAMGAVAAAYLAFAERHPALYEAMFTMAVGLDFAQPDTRPELKDAFAALASVVEPPADAAGIATETFWGALHGLAALERSGRIRPGYRTARLGMLVDGVLGVVSAGDGKQESTGPGRSR